METRHRPSLAEDCPVDAALDVIRDRWKGTILGRPEQGPMRTSELRRSIPQITERMLIRHLHELVADGVIDRVDAGAIPPHVTYSLSACGRTLGPIVWELCRWGEVHLARRSSNGPGSAARATDSTPAGA